MQVKKQHLELDMEQWTGSKLGKEYDKAVYAEYIMQNAWLDEAQAGIKIAGRNIINLRHADDTILKGESRFFSSRHPSLQLRTATSAMWAVWAVHWLTSPPPQI